jgi:asparagine synthase (glutamine-hydrolysing)
LVPARILERQKQPYRSPDALSFASPEATGWVDEVTSIDALRDGGVFAPAAARQLIDKCRARAGSGQFSNIDNMGVVGILSTQLVHDHFIRRRPHAVAPQHIRTVVDRVAAPANV